MTLDEVAAKPPIELVDQTDQRRFSGLSRLYGVQGALRIRSAHVAVIGSPGAKRCRSDHFDRSRPHR